MRTIPLTGGEVALVDDADYEALSKDRWRTNKRKGGNKYAINSKRQLMHRVIMELKGRRPMIDHKDGNGLNNQRNNLRIATPSQNGANRRKSKNSSSSMYLGVYLTSYSVNHHRYTYWRALLKHNGKKIHCGYHKSELEAAKAYDQAAQKYHGEFARLNFQSESKANIKAAA